MKNTIITIFAFLFIVNAQAQEPKKIISIAIKFESAEWYKEQTQAWKKLVDQNPKDEDTWYNYLKAYYYSDEYNAEDSEKIMKRAQKEIPGTYTYFYFMNRASNDNAYLDSAYTADPTSTDIWEAKLVKAITENDQQNKVLFAEKLFNSDEEDPSLYHWSYNQLASLEDKAVVFTHGDNDTFGSWILQLSKGFRSDVTVVNTSLMHNEKYAKVIWNKLLPDEKQISIQSYYEDNKIPFDNGYIYFQFFIKKLNEKKYPVHLTIWSPSQYKEGMEDDFYLTGLTYRFDPSGKFSSIAALRKNFERVYKLDYIEQRYFSNIWDEKAKHMNKMYLTGLLKLYVHYEMTNETEKLEKVNHLLKVIEPNSENRAQFGEFIKEETGENPIEFNGLLLNMKKFLKQFEPINANLFASKTETTNAEFRLFLEDLKKNDRAKFLRLTPDSTLFTKNEFKGEFLNPMMNMYHNHPAYDKYPVVNITKEAALAYCEWLTLQYNNDPKRKWNKVEFKLPTEKEWMQAVTTTVELQNETSCYLLNGKAITDNKADYQCDGGMLTVKVDSYLENEKGLFCTYGNVSEMIADKDYSKGGGWNTEFKKIKPEGKFENGAHPTVGFRVFMKVIEQ